MAVEHVMFKFEDLKVNSHYDRQGHRMTTKVLRSRPRIICGETNKKYYFKLLCCICMVLSSYTYTKSDTFYL